MKKSILIILLTSLTCIGQYYESKSNTSIEITHFEEFDSEIYGDRLIYGAPDENGFQHPIYRIESFDDYLYRTVDIQTDEILSTHRYGGRNIFSRYGKYWASKSAESQDYNNIYGVEDNGPVLLHQSEIFSEGELLHISELGDKYLTRSYSNAIKCFSISGKLQWSYAYPLDDFNRENCFLTSDESSLILHYPKQEVMAISMNSGQEIWRESGDYIVKPIPFQATSDIVLLNKGYAQWAIVDGNGKEKHDLRKAQSISGDYIVWYNRLVNNNIVIPNLYFEEDRIKLPAVLGYDKHAEPLTPHTWSIQGNYYARMYVCWDLENEPDSSETYYRIDVGSADGRKMGFFYPKFHSGLDISKVKLQISIDGSRVQLLARRAELSQFIYREYEVRLF